MLALLKVYPSFVGRRQILRVESLVGAFLHIGSARGAQRVSHHCVAATYVQGSHDTRRAFLTLYRLRCHP